MADIPEQKPDIDLSLTNLAIDGYTLRTDKKASPDTYPFSLLDKDMQLKEPPSIVAAINNINDESSKELGKELSDTGVLSTDGIYEDHEFDKQEQLNNVLAGLGTPSVIPYSTYVQAKKRVLDKKKQQSKCRASGPLIDIRPHTVKKTDPRTGKVVDTGEVNEYYLGLSRDFDDEVIVSAWETGVGKGFWSDTFDYVKAEWQSSILEMQSELEGTKEFIEEQWRNPDSVLYDQGLYLPVGGLTIRSKPPGEYATDLLMERGFNFEYITPEDFETNVNTIRSGTGIGAGVELFFSKGDKNNFFGFVTSDFFRGDPRIPRDFKLDSDPFREIISQSFFEAIVEKTREDINDYFEDWKESAPNSKEEADAAAAELGDKYKAKFFDPYRNLVGRDIGTDPKHKQLLSISPTKQQIHRNEELINLKKKQLTALKVQKFNQRIPGLDSRITELETEIINLQNENSFLQQKLKSDAKVTQRDLDSINEANQEIDILIKKINQEKSNYERLTNDIDYLQARSKTLTQKEEAELKDKISKKDELKKQLDVDTGKLIVLEHNRDSLVGHNSPGQVTKQLYQKALADRNLVTGMINKIKATAADSFDESLCCLIKKFILPHGTWDPAQGAWSRVFSEKANLDERLRDAKKKLENTEVTLKRIVLLMKMLFQEIVFDGEAIVKMIAALISPIIQGVICSLLVAIRSLISALAKPIIDWAQKVAEDEVSCLPFHKVIREVLDTIEKLYRRLKTLIVDYAKTIQLRVQLPKELVIRKAHKNKLRHFIQLVERDILPHIDLFENWIEQMLKFDIETEAQNFVDAQVTGWLQRNGYDTTYNRATGKVEKIQNILAKCGDRPGAKPFKPKSKEEEGGGLKFILAAKVNSSITEVKFGNDKQKIKLPNSSSSTSTILVKPSPDLSGIKINDFVSITNGNIIGMSNVKGITILPDGTGSIMISPAFDDPFFVGDEVTVFLK